VLLLIPAFASAEGSPAPADAPPPVPPKDTREKWTVGFSAFTGARLAGVDAYLVYSIPLLLKDRVSAVPTHAFSVEEKEAHRRRAVTRESAEQLKQLSGVRTDRDALAFDPKADAARREELDKKTDSLLGRIAELSAIRPELVEFQDAKPVEFKDGTGQGNLFDAPRFSVLELCRNADLDLLVHGSIEMVQGYLLIEVRAYDAALEKDVYSWREAAPREEIYTYLETASSGLMRAVVGSEFALLDVAVVPDDAAVLLDGEPRTAGTLVTTPGFHVLSVSAPGYRGESREVDLPSGSETAVSLGLTAEARVPLTVSSQPPGASVYLDSVFQGTTPWIMDKPSLKRHLLLSMDGYLDGATRVDAGSPENLMLNLQTDLIPPAERQKERRDRFYVAFGSMVVALPVPVFLFVISQDYAAAAVKAAKAGYSNATVLSSTGNLCFYTAAGSAAAFVGICAYMVITLIDYINAADRPAG